MRLEERISRSLTGLDHVDTTPPGLDDVVARGTSIKRRRIGTIAVAAVAVLAIAGGIALPRWGDESVEPAPITPEQWERMGPMPEALGGDMSQHVTHWTGDELLVIRSDYGAAYDPATDDWRRIDDPPMANIGTWAGDGETVVVHDGRVAPGSAPRNVVGSVWVYDAATDEWRDWGGDRWTVKAGTDIALHGRTMYALHDDARLGETLQTFGLDDHAWDSRRLSSESPPLDARAVLAIDEGVFVSGYTSEPAEGGEPVVVERLRNGRWTRYDPSPEPGMLLEHWTGERLVEATPVNHVRLDPETGVWSRLPDMPLTRFIGWASAPRGSGPLLVGMGGVYDDRSETWIKVDRPAGMADYVAGVIADGSLYALGGVDEEDDPVTELWRLSLE